MALQDLRNKEPILVTVPVGKKSPIVSPLESKTPDSSNRITIASAPKIIKSSISTPKSPDVAVPKATKGAIFKNQTILDSDIPVRVKSPPLEVELARPVQPQPTPKPFKMSQMATEHQFDYRKSPDLSPKSPVQSPKRLSPEPMSPKTAAVKSPDMTRRLSDPRGSISSPDSEVSCLSPISISPDNITPPEPPAKPSLDGKNQPERATFTIQNSEHKKNMSLTMADIRSKLQNKKQQSIKRMTQKVCERGARLIPRCDVLRYLLGAEIRTDWSLVGCKKEKPKNPFRL